MCYFSLCLRHVSNSLDGSRNHPNLPKPSRMKMLVRVQTLVSRRQRPELGRRLCKRPVRSSGPSTGSLQRRKVDTGRESRAARRTLASTGLDLIIAKHIWENRMERETTELQKEAKAYLDAMRCGLIRLLVSPLIVAKIWFPQQCLHRKAGSPKPLKCSTPPTGHLT